jgi:hypothetical protein
MAGAINSAGSWEKGLAGSGALQERAKNFQIALALYGRECRKWLFCASFHGCCDLWTRLTILTLDCGGDSLNVVVNFYDSSMAK